MKKIIHLIIPISILVWGFSSYQVLSSFLPSSEQDRLLLNQMRELQIKEPSKANDLGVHFHIQATEAKIESDLLFKEGLHKILLGGTLIMFILSLGREYVSFKSQR